jgi:glucose/arabinose dehydrogenase
MTATAMAQDGPPPPPTAANGATVETLAHAGSVPTPLAFAFGGGTTFVAAGGSEDGKTPGGIFTVANGTATPVPGSEGFVTGLTWRKGVLYSSSNGTGVAWRGWNGTAFASHKTVFKGPKGFPGLGGIGFGPDGRLYAGVSLSLDQKYDHKKSPQPYAQSVISMSRTGKKVRVIASGLRQPWQLTFVGKQKYPYVSVLGQDAGKPKNPPDYIVHIKPGQSYGFPTCTHKTAKPCKGFAKPFALLPSHLSPMGIGAIGKTLYVALFSKMEVDTYRKGKLTPFLSGFVAPVPALGISDGFVYAGDLTGAVYRVKAS